MVKSEYISVTGTARRLSRSENTIRLWERQGKLVALKTENGRRIFHRNQVEQLAKQLRGEGQQ